MGIAHRLGLGLALWGWFVPRPYDVVVIVLIATPWIAVACVARSNGRYTLNGSKTDRRPDPAPLLLMPGFILVLRALLDLNVLDLNRAFVWMAITAGALLAATAWADAGIRNRRVALALGGVVLCAYGFGATVLANARLDQGAAETIEARVIDRHVATGRSRTPELHLGAWGPVQQESTVTVSWATYRAVAPGGSACVQLHPGAFGIRWYVVSPCNGASGSGGGA